MRNLITDVAGLKVGHAEDLALGSGATVVVFDEPAVASVDVRGGGPGPREIELDGRTIITPEAEQDWRREREAETMAERARKVSAPEANAS